MVLVRWTKCCTGCSLFLSKTTYFPLQHIFGRIFYPVARKRFFSFGSGARWLPGIEYAYGIAFFLFYRRPKTWLNWVLRHVIFILVYILGSLQQLYIFHGAKLLEISDTKFPVVVFSHGLAGNRSLYSLICIELASQGYIVLALEHADGTASVAKVAGHTRKFIYYQGLGDEEGQVEKTRYRIQEMKTSYKILRALHKGDSIPGLVLSRNKDPRQFFRGKIEMRCLAAVGHSYGGATVAGLVSEDPMFRCGISLDPWWPALPSESAALRGWRTKNPLLVVGSHDWNVPGSDGQLKCDGKRQASVLNACKIKQENGGRNGSGALFLSISGSSHNTFADPLPLFSERVSWVFDMLGLTAELDPVLGIHLVNLAILNFLSMHLPLTANQRQLQTWSPSSSSHRSLEHLYLDRSRYARVGRNRGPLWFLHKGKGLLATISDYLLAHVLSTAVTKSRSDSESTEFEPEDIVTREEVRETLSLVEPEQAAETIIMSSDAAQSEHRHLSTEERQSFRLGLGRLYAETVHESHTKSMTALLGEENLFSCKAITT